MTARRRREGLNFHIVFVLWGFSCERYQTNVNHTIHQVNVNHTIHVPVLTFMAGIKTHVVFYFYLFVCTAFTCVIVRMADGPGAIPIRKRVRYLAYILLLLY